MGRRRSLRRSALNETTDEQFAKGVSEVETGMGPRGLYCPYAFGRSTVTSFDLSEGYDYTAAGTDWYIDPQALLEKGPLPVGQRGMWSAPYFDAGAGNIDMITYSVPVADAAGDFLCIATIDIDMKDVMCTSENNCTDFKCAAGFEARVDDSKNAVCVPCGSGSYNTEEGSTCKACPVGGYCPGGSTIARSTRSLSVMKVSTSKTLSQEPTTWYFRAWGIDAASSRTAFPA